MPGVEPGRRVSLRTTRAAAEYTVTATVSGSAVYFSDEEANTLAVVHAVGVLAKPGVHSEDLADTLSAQLGVSTFTGDDRSQVERPDVARARGDLTEMAGALGGSVVVIAILVVAGTLSVNVHQRRRELALMRAVGAAPKQIHRMLAAEALVLSIVAAVAGCPLGILAAQILRQVLVLAGMVPGNFAFSHGILPMIVAVATCLLAVQVAVFGVSRTSALVAAASILLPARLVLKGERP